MLVKKSFQSKKVWHLKQLGVCIESRGTDHEGHLQTAQCLLNC